MNPIPQPTGALGITLYAFRHRLRAIPDDAFIVRHFERGSTVEFARFCWRLEPVAKPTPEQLATWRHRAKCQQAGIIPEGASK